MKKGFQIVFVLMCICVFTGKAQNNSIQYGFLLDSVLLDSAKIKEPFINAIDISPNKLIVLSSQNKVYTLGWLGINQIAQINTAPISSFAFTHDSVLMLVAGKDLLLRDTSGKFLPVVKLPMADMRLSRGGEVMYLFDNKFVSGKIKYGLYVLAPGGKYKKILSSPQPISAVTEMNKQLYVAIGSGIYTLNLSNNELQLVFALQKEMSIKSLTVDYANDILYFSTTEEVYAWKNNNISYITGDFGGGIIQYFDNGILLFNPSTKDLLRITSISAKVKMDF